MNNFISDSPLYARTLARIPKTKSRLWYNFNGEAWFYTNAQTTIKTTGNDTSGFHRSDRRERESEGKWEIQAMIQWNPFQIVKCPRRNSCCADTFKEGRGEITAFSSIARMKQWVLMQYPISVCVIVNYFFLWTVRPSIPSFCLWL